MFVYQTLKVKVKNCFLAILLLCSLVTILLGCNIENESPSNSLLSRTPSPTNITPPRASLTQTNIQTPVPSPTISPNAPPSPTNETETLATPTMSKAFPLQFEHQTDNLPDELVTQQMARWLYLANPQDELSLESLHNSAQPEEKLILNREEAEEDIDYLFRVLKHGYAGYGFFNEENKIDLAKVQLFEFLQGRNEVTSLELAELIHEQLSFIQDCHMMIGANRFFNHFDYWYWDEIDFFQRDGQFGFLGDKGEYWLETVDGRAPTEFMKLVLNQNGVPVYQLTNLSQTKPSNFTLSILQEDGTRDLISGEWKQSLFSGQGKEYSQYTVEGIPIIVSRRFWGDENSLSQFVDDAEDLRDESIIIVDIRGNNGGTSWWPQNWMAKLTDSEVQPTFLIGELQTRTSIIGKINWPNSENVLEDALELSYTQLEELESGIRPRGWVNYEPDHSVLSNLNQLIIVLIDRNTASAAESFVASLRQLKNVVFIGENSQGCIHYGETGFYYLPNSGIMVQIGTKLFLTQDLGNIEGEGFKPDLWVPADQAVQRTLAAVRQGWLQPPD